MYESFPKSKPMGSHKKFDTESYPDSWNNSDNAKRDCMKSGRDEYAGSTASNYKVKVGKESPGNTSRREYPKKGNSTQGGFGTGA